MSRFPVPKWSTRFFFLVLCSIGLSLLEWSCGSEKPIYIDYEIVGLEDPILYIEDSSGTRIVYQKDTTRFNELRIETPFKLRELVRGSMFGTSLYADEAPVHGRLESTILSIQIFEVATDTNDVSSSFSFQGDTVNSVDTLRFIPFFNRQVSQGRTAAFKMLRPPVNDSARQFLFTYIMSNDSIFQAITKPISIRP